MAFKIALGITIIIGSYCMASPYESAIFCAETRLHKAARSGNIKYIQEAAADDLYAEDCHGRTPMHVAVRYNRLRFIEALAGADFDVNRLNGEALPILHYSVVNGSMETTKVLLTIGSIPNAVNALRETPLYLSLHKHDEEVSKLLVASGASITLMDILGNTLAHAFAERKDLGALKLLVTLNGELDVENYNQETPLLIAVKNNSPSIINFLLAHGASISKLPYLHSALAAKAYNSLRALLENGISTMSEAKDGLSAIELAVKNELAEAVDILGSFRSDLLSGYSFSKQSSKKLNDNSIAYQNKVKYGNSVLHVSVKYNKTEIVKTLLSKHGGHNIDEEGEGGNTAMELAIRNDNADIMEILALFGADISRSSQDKGSLMNQAIESESNKAVVWLLDHGVSPMERDKDGNTHLHIAAKLGKIEVMKSLLSSKGAVIIEEEGENNNTAMELAIKNDDTKIMELLASYGANIHRHNLVNGSLLKQAVMEKSNKAVVWLIDHGAQLEEKDSDGNTVLHVAVRLGEVETIKALLSKNGSALVAMEGKENNTAMELAIIQDRTDIMEELASFGADIHRPSSTKGSLLKLAAIEKSNKAIVWLIDHGAHREERDSDGNTVLNVAVGLGEIETIKALLSKNGSAIVDIEGEEGYTAMELAIIQDRTDIMEELASFGADVHRPSSTKGSLLKLAAIEKSNKAIVWLIDHGAHREERDSDGNTVLNVAVGLGEIETIKALLSKNGSAIVDIEGEEGYTAMELAIIQDRTDIMEVLASFGADVHRPSSTRGSLLKLAIMEKSNKAVVWLIDHGADRDETDDCGTTLLHVAVRVGDIETIKALLFNNGSAIVEKEGANGNTAMELAVVQDRTDIMEVLASYGAGIYRSNTVKGSLLKQATVANSRNSIVWLIDHGVDTNEKDKEGNTLLHIAAKLGKLGSVKALLSRKGKFDVNSRAKDNFTPLINAVYSNHSSIIKELLNHGADIEAIVGGCHVLPAAASSNLTESVLELLSHPVDVDSKCGNGNTALILSSALNNLKVVKKLIELGANVNIIGQEKKSALIWAVANAFDMNDKYDIVKVLLENGAEVNWRDESGHTVLYYAKKYGHTISIDLIESKGGISI